MEIYTSCHWSYSTSTHLAADISPRHFWPDSYFNLCQVELGKVVEAYSSDDSHYTYKNFFRSYCSLQNSLVQQHLYSVLCVFKELTVQANKRYSTLLFIYSCK